MHIDKYFRIFGHVTVERLIKPILNVDVANRGLATELGPALNWPQTAPEFHAFLILQDLRLTEIEVDTIPTRQIRFNESGVHVYTKAEDIMTKDPMTLDTSTDILFAVDFFLEKKISSVPVTSTLGEIEGQLTELVLVRMLILFQLQPEKYKKLAHCTELLEPAVFVAPDDLFSILMKAIMKSPSRRLLVRKDGRKILGIISPKDMLRGLIANRANAELVK